ncbi:MAG TPA: phage holin family protein [Bryocella sp.]|nr:phage holin family protein [Bryocella sp.]
MSNAHAKTVPEALADLREDLKEFVTTRAMMLRSELREKLRMIRMAAPAMLIGILILAMAGLLFTGFLVCIIAQVFMPSPWAYSLSFILVAVLYAIVGGAASYLGWQQLRATGIRPERTIHVLEQDRVWLQTEAKSQL